VVQGQVASGHDWLVILSESRPGRSGEDEPGVEAIGSCVHKRRALNTRLSSGTSSGTFACPAGPYRNGRGEAGTKNEPNWYFVPVSEKGPRVDAHVSNLKSREFLFRGVQVRPSSSYGGHQTSIIWISRLDGFPVHSFEWWGFPLRSENLIENLKTPEKTCLICTGTLVKLVGNLGSRNYFKADLLRP